jgi:hypothetical protein
MDPNDPIPPTLRSAVLPSAPSIDPARAKVPGSWFTEGLVRRRRPRRRGDPPPTLRSRQRELALEIDITPIATTGLWSREGNRLILLGPDALA